MNGTTKRFNNGYEAPKLSVGSVCVERGFYNSGGMLDNVYETEGSWD